jgi:UDP-glucose 4-epimerase
VLRVSNAFGPFQVPLKNQGIIATLISRALRNEAVEVWGDGSVVRDFVFVDDIMDALEAAAGDQSNARIFNIGSGQGRTLRELIAAIELLLGRKLEIRWKDKRSIDVPISVLSVERARDVLGWTPNTPFEKGLKKTVSWWQSRKT